MSKTFEMGKWGGFSLGIRGIEKKDYKEIIVLYHKPCHIANDSAKIINPDLRSTCPYCYEQIPGPVLMAARLYFSNL